MSLASQTFIPLALMASTLVMPFQAAAERGNGRLELDEDFTSAALMKAYVSDYGYGVGAVSLAHTLSEDLLIYNLEKDGQRDKAKEVDKWLVERVYRGRVISSEKEEALTKRIGEAMYRRSSESFESIFASTALEIANNAPRTGNSKPLSKDTYHTVGYYKGIQNDTQRTIALMTAISTLAYWEHLEGNDFAANEIIDNFTYQRYQADVPGTAFKKGDFKYDIIPSALPALGKELNTVNETAPDTPLAEIVLKHIDKHLNANPSPSKKILETNPN